MKGDSAEVGTFVQPSTLPVEKKEVSSKIPTCLMIGLGALTLFSSIITPILVMKSQSTPSLSGNVLQSSSGDPIQVNEHVLRATIADIEFMPMNSLQKLHNFYFRLSEKHEAFYQLTAAHREPQKTTLVLGNDSNLVIDYSQAVRRATMMQNNEEVAAYTWELTATGTVKNFAFQSVHSDEIKVAEDDSTKNENVAEGSSAEDLNAASPSGRRLTKRATVVIAGVDTTAQYGASAASYLNDPYCQHFPCLATVGVSYPFYNQPYGTLGYSDYRNGAWSNSVLYSGLSITPVATMGGLPRF